MNELNGSVLDFGHLQENYKFSDVRSRQSNLVWVVSLWLCVHDHEYITVQQPAMEWIMILYVRRM